MEAGSDTQIAVPRVVVGQPGVYEVSAYVRVKAADGTYADSDAVRLTTPVALAPFDSSIRRGFLPGGPIIVETIYSPQYVAGGQQVDVTVRLHNLTASDLTAASWFLLGPPGSTTPWVGAGYVRPPAEVSVPAHGSVTLSLPWTVSAPSGGWELSAWVRWKNPASGAGFVDSDGAWFTHMIHVS